MSAFVPADPLRQARLIGPDDIHVWRSVRHGGDGRATVRRLLAVYLQTQPEAIRFVQGAHGRPALAAPHAGFDINWSHSGECLVLAIARRLPVLGVDFERHRSRARALQLARRFYHPDEAEQLARLPASSVSDGFLRLWTAKEAVLKALGEGLRFGLDRVRFRLHASSVDIDTFDSRAGPVSEWHLSRVDDETGFSCLAWRGPARCVHWFVRAGD